MINKIVLASSNAGKIKELTELLVPLNIDVIPQSAFNIPDAEESGLTFVENAIIKARNAAQISGLPALADDSGITVDALNGAPGIYSARYSGENANAQSNMKKLLQEMHDIPDEKRQAAFHCVLAFMLSPDDPAPVICDGIWRGIVMREQRGKNGHGYDPVFFIPSENKTVAELSAEVKNNISHRGMALRMLIKQLSLSEYRI